MRLIGLLCLCLAAAPLASAQTPAPPAPPAAPAPPAPPSPLDWGRYPSATEVQLRDVAAYVRVRAYNRPDVAVAILNPGPLPAPRISLSGRRLVIDGQLRRQIRGCEVSGRSGFEVQTRRRGDVGGADLPVIELRVPQNVVVSVSGAARLTVGPSTNAQISLEGCGDADIERVDEAANLSVSGSSDLRLYDAGDATVALAGAGDVTLGLVRSGLTVSIAGSGDLTAARADGPTNIAIQGAGDVLIREGRATTLSVAIVGSGDVIHNGSAERLDAAIFGSGDVHVRQVDGPVTRRVLGGGEVVVGR